MSTLLVVHHSKVLTMSHDEVSFACKIAATLKPLRECREVYRHSYLLNVARSDRGPSALARTLAPRVGAAILSTRTRGHPRATPMNIFRDVTFPPASTGLISIVGSKRSVEMSIVLDIFYSLTWTGLPTTLKNLL